MTELRDNVDVLLTCLRSESGRFSKYQELPPFVLEKLGGQLEARDYQKSQLALDAARYDFFLEACPKMPATATEIGSNLGYFCLRLAHDFSCRTVGFEPMSSYVTAASAMAAMSDLDRVCNFRQEPVNLDDIQNLAEVDMLIELNVLHHAGVIFDVDAVSQSGGWRTYAVERLALLRERAKSLLFQTGNTANSRTLFPTVEAAEFIDGLLREAGWQIKAIGAVSDIQKMRYRIWSAKQIADVRTYHCERDRHTNLVSYRVGEELVAFLPTGLANRPIWYCSR